MLFIISLVTAVICFLLLIPTSVIKLSLKVQGAKDDGLTGKIKNKIEEKINKKQNKKPHILNKGDKEKKSVKESIKQKAKDTLMQAVSFIHSTLRFICISSVLSSLVTGLLVFVLIFCIVATAGWYSLNKENSLFDSNNPVSEYNLSTTPDLRPLAKWLSSFICNSTAGDKSGPYSQSHVVWQDVGTGTESFKQGTVEKSLDFSDANVYSDCSGGVSLMLYFCDFDTTFSRKASDTLDTWGENISASTFNDIQIGDVLVNPGSHAAIVVYKDDSKVYTFDWGSGQAIKDTAANGYAQSFNLSDSITTWRETTHVRRASNYATAIAKLFGGTQHNGTMVAGDWTEFFQSDYSEAYSSSTIAECGCGLCSSCVVAEHYTGNTGTYTPSSMRLEVVAGGNTGLGANKSTEAITDFFKNHTEIGVTATYYGGSIDLNALDNAIANGGCAIVDYGPTIRYNGSSVWTAGGHYVVICGGNQTDGYSVRDSNKGHNSGSSGIKDWCPYNSHIFAKEYIQDCKYYYLITKN